MLIDGIMIFDSCLLAASYLGVPYMIENPAINRFNTHRRPPDFKFHPWHYAGYLSDCEVENTNKITGLWTGHGFVMPENKPAKSPHRNDCHEEKPSADRADIRSITPMGFAKAIFLANRE